ncbi:tripartite tricarboxylate transporter permease [Propionispira raffinosivorans]|uniref:tripartite tricarboxylate transporter permease n=1 Tax=Propionispira raffinosivorans TaxID=86959 RepID=UPI00035EEAD6|nr:tripartite tricarboxylate transporter permease [Propionispira raffinosivorans]
MDTGIFLSQFRVSLFLELLPILFLGVFCGMFFCLTAKLQAEAVAAFVLPFTIHLPLAIAVGLVLAVYGGGRYGALLLGSMRARFDLSVAAASVASRFSHRETTEKIFFIGQLASIFGFTTSLVVLFYGIPVVAQWNIDLATADLFAALVCILCVAIVVSGKSVGKGLISALLGLLLCTIGSDPISTYSRWTYGVERLFNGVPPLPLILGVMVLSDILTSLERFVLFEKTKHIAAFLPNWGQLKMMLLPMVTGSILGLLIGVIPAAARAAAFISCYDTKRAARRKKNPFVLAAASQAAQASSSVGSMFSLLLFGIPGTRLGVILFMTFLLHGLSPASFFGQPNIEVIDSVLGGAFVTGMLLIGLGFCGMHFFAVCSRLDGRILLPILFVITVAGVYLIHQSFFDVYLTILFGIIGYIRNRYRYPLLPFLLAFILGPIIEVNLRHTLAFSAGDFSILLTNPLALILLITAILLLLMTFLKQWSYTRYIKENM